MKVSSIIKSPVTRKIAATAMLVSASLGVTNVSANNNKIQHQESTKTELMSKETANILSAYTNISHNTQKPIRQLETFYRYLDSALVQAINSTYDEYGELGGSAFSSYIIHANKVSKLLEKIKKDYYAGESKERIALPDNRYYVAGEHVTERALEEIEEANRKRPYANYQSLNDNKEAFEQRLATTENLLQSYFNICHDQIVLLMNKNASAQEYFDTIDTIMAIVARDLKDPSLAERYNNLCNRYEGYQRTQGIQKQMDLIAYKMFIMDQLVVEKILKITQLRYSSPNVLAQQIDNFGNIEEFLRGYEPKTNPQ